MSKGKRFDNSASVRIVQQADKNGQLDELKEFLSDREQNKRCEIKQPTRDKLVADLLSGKHTRKLLEEQKLALLNFKKMRMGSAILYNWLLEKTGHTLEDQKVLSEYVGNYIQLIASSTRKNFFSKAKLRILFRNNRYTYENEIRLPSGKPFTYEGFVVYAKPIIYFTGLNKNWARPFMCYPLGTRKNLTDSVIVGGMLGLQEKRKSIYYREFRLIHSNNKIFSSLEIMTDEEIGQSLANSLFAHETLREPTLTK